jgi:hypothetical protein
MKKSLINFDWAFFILEQFVKLVFAKCDERKSKYAVFRLLF